MPLEESWQPSLPCLGYGHGHLGTCVCSSLPLIINDKKVLKYLSEFITLKCV